MDIEMYENTFVQTLESNWTTKGSINQKRASSFQVGLRISQIKRILLYKENGNYDVIDHYSGRLKNENRSTVHFNSTTSIGTLNELFWQHVEVRSRLNFTS